MKKFDLKILILTLLITINASLYATTLEETINAAGAMFESVFTKDHLLSGKDSPLVLQVKHDIVVDVLPFILFANDDEDTLENRTSIMSNSERNAEIKNIKSLKHHGFEIYLKTEKGRKGLKIGYITTIHASDKISIDWLLINPEYRGRGYTKEILGIVERIYRSRISQLPPACRQLRLMTTYNSPIAKVCVKSYTPMKTTTEGVVVFIKEF